MNQNTTSQNFDLARELREQDSRDWKFGALSQPGIVSIPPEERENYLPTGETQFDKFTDFSDCASRSPVNHLEALFTYHYKHGMKEENKQWMEKNGYVKASQVTFSDRFIAVLSGTTHSGNSLKSPVDTIRTKGLIPKSLLPKTDDLTWEQYYAPIPQNLLDLGQEFLKRFTINYEQVFQVHFEDVLKDDMIGTAGYAWPVPINGVFPKSAGDFNHAFLLYKLPKYNIYDNYQNYNPQDGTLDTGGFTKVLAPDYTLFDYGYRVYVSAENIPDPLSTLPTAQAASLWDWLVKMITWIANGSKPPMPQIPSEILPEQKPADFLTAFCLAIKQHEGWATPGQTIGGVYYQNGSVSYRCNNPGNTRFYTGGYLTIYGTVQESTLGKNAAKGIHGFAQFKDYATGYLYLKNLVTSKIKKHPAWTFYDFFGDPKEGWAPASDNNDSKRYAEIVAKACGVQPTRTLFNLL